MYGAELYRRLAAETGVDLVVARGRLAPAGLDAGALRGAPAPGRLGEDVRAAARADLAPRRRSERFPLMSLDGVLGAVWLPTDGWLDPSGPGPGAGRRRPRRAASRSASTRGSSGIGVRARPGHAASRSSTDGERSTIAAEVVVNAGGMFAPEIGRLAGVTVPIIPMAHQYLFTERDRGRPRRACPTMRDPDNLVYFREEVGGLCMGGYERDPAPWSLDGVPPDFNGRLLAPDWPRFEAIMDGRHPARARDRRRRRHPDDQRARGVHARTTSSSSARARSAGSSWPPGSAPTASPARAASASRWPSWIVDGEPELDLWKMDIRRFGGAVPEPGATPSPGRTRTTRPTTTSTTRTRSGRPAGRCASRPAYDAARRARRGLRREVGLGAPELVRAERGRRRRRRRAALEALRPRGWAGEHWSPAIGAEALATRHGGRPVRRVELRQDRGRRARARSPSSSACAPTTSTGRSARIAYTQMLNRRGGIECDFTVTRLADGPLPDRDRHGLRQPRPRLDPQAPAADDGDASAVARRDLGAGLLRAVGAAGARHPRSRSRGRRLGRRPSRT